MVAATVRGAEQYEKQRVCSISSRALLYHQSWIQTVCSPPYSLGMIWTVRYKSGVESQLERLLEREKGDWNLLAKCVDGLKKKGIKFDLLKEVDALRRAKSLRV